MPGNCCSDSCSLLFFIVLVKTIALYSKTSKLKAIHTYLSISFVNCNNFQIGAFIKESIISLHENRSNQVLYTMCNG